MYNNKRIAENTLFLYLRMILVMGVTLYTSRVVLDKLGVDDFSLCNVVGGIVGMLAFLNNSLSTGTARFLTYDLGSNAPTKLNNTFNTTLYSHILLGIFLLIIFETVGLWYIYNKLVVDPARFDAALIIFQISIFAMLISIVQVPYTSLVIAHEEMGIFAYIGIFEALAKLGAVYLLIIVDVDKLILYAILMAIIQILVALAFWLYCKLHYIESRLKWYYDKRTFRSLISFSSWSIIANLSETLKLQGYLVLLNLFFQPFVVAAQTIGNQVANAIMQFVGNFRKAIEPQIIKLYAAKDYDESKRLTLSTAVLVFDMVLLLGLPSIYAMKVIMDLWLVEVPAYTVVFTQWIIVQRMISTFDASFYTPLVAAAKIKTNSLYAILFGPGLFVILYFLFKFELDVMWLQYVGLAAICIYSFWIKPSLLVKEVKGYKYRDFLPCYITCIKVAVLSVGLSYGAYLLIGNDKIGSAIALFIISAVCVAFSSYIFLDKPMKEKVHVYIVAKIRRIQNR